MKNLLLFLQTVATNGCEQPTCVLRLIIIGGSGTFSTAWPKPCLLAGISWTKVKFLAPNLDTDALLIRPMLHVN